MKLSMRYITVLFGMLVLAPIAVMGQSTDELCEEFINVVFPEIATTCANLGVASSCLGYGEINPTFYQDGQPLQELPELFETGQTPSLEGDEGIVQESFEAQLFQLNRENVLESEWGVALQEVRANLPTQEDDTALFVLYGGARLENDILPEDAVVLPDEPVAVSYDRVNVFSSPPELGYTVESEQIETLSGGGELEADAISPDGAWLRVFFPYDREFGERLTAWVSVDELTDVAGIEDLPILGPEDYTTMQKFYLENPLIVPGCEIVPPPGVLIQGPDRTEVDLIVNDLPFRVTSTAFIRRVSDENFILEVTSVVGITVIYPETENEIVVVEGESEYFCQTPLESFGINTLPDDRQVTERCEGESDILDRLQGLEGFPENILNYPIEVPVRVCFSGVGGPVCEVRYVSVDRLTDLCESDAFADVDVQPADICEIVLDDDDS